MSISIDGYRFESGISAFTAARRIRARLGDIAVKYDITHLLVEAVRVVDDADANGTERPTGGLPRALKDHLADRRAGESPTLGRCSVFLGEDPEDPTGRVYVYLNASSEFSDAMTTIPGVTEFGYFNASDWLPEGVTRAEFGARKPVWDRVIPTRTPKVDMLAVEVRDPYDLELSSLVRNRREHVEDLLALTPDLATRAHSVAFSLLWQAVKATGEDPFIGRLFFGQPIHVRRAVAAALDADLPRAVILDDLDSSPAPDLAEARSLAAQWVADGMPEDPIDEDGPDSAAAPAGQA